MSLPLIFMCKKSKLLQRARQLPSNAWRFKTNRIKRDNALVSETSGIHLSLGLPRLAVAIENLLNSALKAKVSRLRLGQDLIGTNKMQLQLLIEL